MLVVANEELLRQIVEVQDRLDADSVLRLFKNDLDPDPATELGDFTESDFSGYAEITLDGDWTEPVKIADGHYACNSGDQDFTHNGGGTGNTVYGAYVLVGGLLACSQRFTAPVTMAAGSPPLRVKVTYTQKAEASL